MVDDFTRMCFGVDVFPFVRLLYIVSYLDLYICLVNVLLCHIVYLCVILPRAFARGSHVLYVAIVFWHLDLVGCGYSSSSSP